MNKHPILYYVYDPMCSWCWAFHKTWEKLQSELSGSIKIKYILGGLAADNDAPMPVALQASIRQIWYTIQQQVPGTEFNYDFWVRCQPRRSTYPACRAVIAACCQGYVFEKKMLLAIQQAYYLQARNPSNSEVLIHLAQVIGLDQARFKTDFNAVKTQLQLETEIAFSQQLGVKGFPSLVLRKEDSLRHINFDYNDPLRTLDEINSNN
jgi:putative protein-disulfide isomerase